MTSDNMEFTPETLRKAAKQCEQMRFNLLFDTEDAGADALAEQHFLLAINALETAVRNLKLAAIHQMRALR